jgi:hypothetical protein
LIGTVTACWGKGYGLPAQIAESLYAVLERKKGGGSFKVEDCYFLLR